MSNHYQTARTVTVTTTGNIDDLDFSKAGLIRMNNASDATIRGLKAGYVGQRVTIVSVGAGHVYFSPQDTNSTAANRLLNPITVGNTPLAAGKGAATYQYDGTTERWRLITHAQGTPIAIAYASGNYTASTGTWTVDSADQVTLSYLISGMTKQMRMLFAVVETTTSNATTQLRIALPGSYSPVEETDGLFRARDNTATVSELGLVLVEAGVARLRLQLADGTQWAVSTNNTSVQGQLEFEVT